MRELSKAREEYLRTRHKDLYELDEEMDDSVDEINDNLNNSNDNNINRPRKLSANSLGRNRNRTLSVEEVDKEHRKQASKQLILSGEFETASKLLTNIDNNSNNTNNNSVNNNNNNKLQSLQNKRMSKLNDEDKETLAKEAKEDASNEKKFLEMSKRHNGEKPLLILDVDNTMLFVRFFSDEMKCGDTVTYFENDEVERNNAIVTQMRLTLTLEVDNDDLFEEIGSEIVQCFHFISDPNSVEYLCLFCLYLFMFCCLVF